jgi:hypothetical protein
MAIEPNQTAPASQEKFLSENQPQPQLPREYQPRFESDRELKTFLDEKELLRRLPVSRRTLFNWRMSGKIPSVKIGRRCLYHFPSIESALLRLQRGGGE